MLKNEKKEPKIQQEQKTAAKWWAKVHECDTRSKDSYLKQKKRCKIEGKKFKALRKAKKYAPVTEDAIDYWIQRSFQFFLDKDYRNARDAMEEILAIIRQKPDLKDHLIPQKKESDGDNPSKAELWFKNLALPMMNKDPIINNEKKIYRSENSLEAATFEEPIKEPKEASSTKPKSKSSRATKIQKDNPREGKEKDASITSTETASHGLFSGTNKRDSHSAKSTENEPIVPTQPARKPSHS